MIAFTQAKTTNVLPIEIAIDGRKVGTIEPSQVSPWMASFNVYYSPYGTCDNVHVFGHGETPEGAFKNGVLRTIQRLEQELAALKDFAAGIEFRSMCMPPAVKGGGA